MKRTQLTLGLVFGLTMTFWAAISIGLLMLILAIVAKMDIAFFESNGMIKNADLREAFYMRIFEVEPVVFLLLVLGFVGVGALSYLFGKSQFDYFKRLSTALVDFSQSFRIPSTKSLGQFNPHITSFFHVIQCQISHQDKKENEKLTKQVLHTWPNQPRLSLSDNAQFAAIAGLLAAFFCMVCVIFYWTVSNRVVQLSNHLVRFSNPEGPKFLTEQFHLLSILVWAIMGVTFILFMTTGYKMGAKISEANFAILRDLRAFMEGSHERRIFLRTGDPALELVAPMNEALDRIEAKLKFKDKYQSLPEKTLSS